MTHPNYGVDDDESRAAAAARQAIDTVRPYLPNPLSTLRVLDVGCGHGLTTVHFAGEFGSVVGIEPSLELFDNARGIAERARASNVTFFRVNLEEFSDEEGFDLIVLDNVLEHIPDHTNALRKISSLLRTGGVAYILVPNKLWPVEHHYHLPFLGYLPLPLANRYLRGTGRGRDFSDASFAPTYWSLRSSFASTPSLTWRLVLPASLELVASGNKIHYRLGVAALRKFSWLWPISKALLVVATRVNSNGEEGV